MRNLPLMLTSVVLAVLLSTFTPPTLATDTPSITTSSILTPTAVRSDFKTQLIKAIKASADAGEITRLQAIRLRVACASPAFVKKAQDVAVIQMVFSGDAPELIPYTEDGRVNVDAINWDGLLAFLQAFIPILLEILLAVGL